MKFLHLFLVTGLLAVLPTMPARALDEVAVWKAENVQSDEGRMTWPDAKQGYDLILSDTHGVSVGDPPAAGEDEKSVIFAGTQRKAFVSQDAFPAFAGRLEVRFALNPGSDHSGVIIRCRRQWQIQLKKTGGVPYVELMLWSESGALMTVQTEVRPDVWQEVSASVEDNVARISCGGREGTKKLLEAVLPSPDGAPIFIGLPVAEVSETNRDTFVPFKGAIADFRVSM